MTHEVQAQMQVLIPFGTEYLAMSRDQFSEALRLGRIVAGHSPHTAEPPQTEQLFDAKSMEAATGIPASWFLDQARRGKIPHMRAGKYVRFHLREVMEATKAQPRHADRLSPSAKKQTHDQGVGYGCYHSATK